MEKRRGLLFGIIIILLSGIIFLFLIICPLVSASRLPVVGQDNSTWGDILNDYLMNLAGPFGTQLNETIVNNLINFNGMLSGLGTEGYIAMFNGTTSLNSSIIYQNGSYIGIGTTNPSTTLEINGSVNISGDVYNYGNTYYNGISIYSIGNASWNESYANGLYLRNATPLTPGKIPYANSEGMLQDSNFFYDGTTTYLQKDISNDASVFGLTKTDRQTTAGSKISLNNILSANPDSSSLSDYIAFGNSAFTAVDNSQDLNGNLFGTIYEAYHMGSGTLNGLYGQRINIGSGPGAGIVDNRIGLEVNPSSSAGTSIGNSYGMKISFYSDLGTIGNHYGLYSQASTASNDYGLYILNNKNYFAGNVGIGTNDPTHNLHIKSADHVKIKIETTGSDKHAQYQFSSPEYHWSMGLDENDDDFIFYGQNAVSLNSILPMVIQKDTGNVGIGTNDPEDLLEVNGTARFINSVGVGANPPTSYANLRTYKFVENIGEGSWFGIEARVDSSATEDGTNYIIGVESNLGEMDISPGVTDSGYRVGMRAQAFPNNIKFAGTLSDLRGFWTRAGINNAAPGAIINNAYANYVEILQGPENTHIENAYGLYVKKTSQAGTITNLYDVYASDSDANNYFAGNVSIGNEPTASNTLRVAGDVNVSGKIYYDNGTMVGGGSGGVEGLIAGRVPYTITDGQLADSADMTYKNEIFTVKWGVFGSENEQSWPFQIDSVGDSNGNADGLIITNRYGSTAKQWGLSVDNSYDKGFSFTEVGVGTHLYLEPGGNVGIGTTSNVDGKLTILQDGNSNTIPAIRIIGSSFDPTNYNLDILPYSPGAGQVDYRFNIKNIATETTALTIDHSGNVGIGTNDPEYSLHVKGSEFLENGNLGIGTVPSPYNNAGNEYVLDAARIFTDNTDLTTKRSINSVAFFNPSGSGTIAQYIQGFYGAAQTASGNLVDNNGYLTAGKFDALHRSNSVQYEVSGLNIEVGTYEGGIDTTGTINNLYGIKVTGLKTPSSTIQNVKGLYIYNILGDNPYDIYASDSNAKNYFAGNVSIGNEPTASNTLRVAGDVNVSGKIYYDNGTLVGSSGGNGEKTQIAYFNADNSLVGNPSFTYNHSQVGEDLDYYINQLVIGKATIIDEYEQIYSAGGNPGTRYEIQRPWGGGAFPLFKTYALRQNSGDNALWGGIGIYGDLGPNDNSYYTPIVDYMYFGVEPNFNQGDNTLRLYPNKNAYFAGNVGIGTTTPYEKLHVAGDIGLEGNITLTNNQNSKFIKGNANGGAIRLSSNAIAAGDRNVQFGNIDNNGGWTSYMTIEEAGNVGIGTNEPNGKLTIKTDNTNYPLVNDDAALVIENPDATFGQSFLIFSFNGIPMAGVRGDHQGNFNWHATGEQGQQFYASLDISKPVMGISSSGIIIGGGAGATSPAATLTVGSLGSANRIQIDGNTEGSILGFGNGEYMGDPVTPTYNTYIQQTASGIAANENKLTFNVASGAGSVTNDVLVLQGDGNVGIGTTIPSANLDVFKDVDAETQIKISNPNAGLNAVSKLKINGDVSGLNLGVFSSGYNNANLANRGGIFADDALDGLTFATAGNIKFDNQLTDTKVFFDIPAETYTFKGKMIIGEGAVPGELTINNLAARAPQAGDGYACIDSAGKLFKSTTSSCTP